MSRSHLKRAACNGALIERGDHSIGLVGFESDEAKATRLIPRICHNTRLFYIAEWSQ
jgi:hypothetical protein